MDPCQHHEAIISKIETQERDRGELWESVKEIRNDIKGILSKIGVIVGTITVVNSVALLVVQYVLKK